MYLVITSYFTLFFAQCSAVLCMHTPMHMRIATLSRHAWASLRHAFKRDAWTGGHDAWTAMRGHDGRASSMHDGWRDIDDGKPGSIKPLSKYSAHLRLFIYACGTYTRGMFLEYRAHAQGNWIKCVLHMRRCCASCLMYSLGMPRVCITHDAQSKDKCIRHLNHIPPIERPKTPKINPGAVVSSSKNFSNLKTPHTPFLNRGGLFKHLDIFPKFVTT